LSLYGHLQNTFIDQALEHLSFEIHGFNEYAFKEHRVAFSGRKGPIFWPFSYFPVEAFAGVKKDVGAEMGIMVSTVGFSKAAYQRGVGENILSQTPLGSG
jgi:hypothetical protein